MVEPNVIPLVDIMLVLLIIMIITVPVMTQAVKIDLPKEVNRPTDTKPENINLSIDFDGSIYWNENSVDRVAAAQLRAGGGRQGPAAGSAHPGGQARALRGAFPTRWPSCSGAACAKSGSSREPPPRPASRGAGPRMTEYRPATAGLFLGMTRLNAG